MRWGILDFALSYVICHYIGASLASRGSSDFRPGCFRGLAEFVSSARCLLTITDRTFQFYTAAEIHDFYVDYFVSVNLTVELGGHESGGFDFFAGGVEYQLSAFTHFGFNFYDLGRSFEGASVDFSIAETPLPAALPLFATGIGALGLLGWRRKRKQIA